MATHQVKTGDMTKSIIIPHPDLLDLIKKFLPAEAGVAVMFSVTGGLAFRIGRLAGMVANGFASDLRNCDEPYGKADSWANKRDGIGSIDTYNDAMSHLDSLEAAAQSFEEAGGTRRSMCDDLSKLLHYKRTCDDYLVSLMGESKAPVTNWLSTLDAVAKPAPVDHWKLDHLWVCYLSETGNKPLMTRQEYDVLNVRELSGQHAAWGKHVSSVMNIIDLADRGDAIEFDKLDVQTQLSLLNSYATPERLAKFRASIMKRARSAFEFDATLRLHVAFVEACHLATTHHRYANIGDKLVPKIEPTGKPVPSLRKDNSPVGKFVAQVGESVEKEAKLDAKASKAKPKARVVKQENLKAELSLAEQPNDMP
jgi:hypothetical protein